MIISHMLHQSFSCISTTIQPQHIQPSIGIPHISEHIKPTQEFNRVFWDIPSCLGVVIPKPIITQLSLRIIILSLVFKRTSKVLFWCKPNRRDRSLSWVSIFKIRLWLLHQKANIFELYQALAAYFLTFHLQKGCILPIYPIYLRKNHQYLMGFFLYQELSH